MAKDKEKGSSVAGSGKAKRKAKPTGSRRNRKQKVKETYTKAREEAQLLDIIPTTPEGAIRPERVDSATQENAPQIEILKQAIRQGWAVPEERKARHVDEMSNILDAVEVPAKVKVAAFQALRMADKDQYERDHPEETAKAKKGSAVTVNVSTTQTNIEAAALIREMVASGQLGVIEAESTPAITGASSGGGLERAVEASAPLASDK